eukprot:m.135671 g.135671  ORF g.135671 m.135671 type:complete len:696 (-) comp10129_c0_seq1:385-2472(-)
MYGVLHKALTCWIESLPNGEQLMADILETVDINGAADDYFRYYSDEQTTQFLTSIGRVTGRTLDECKAEAGNFFLVGIMESGYGHTLKTLGNNYFTFLDNLDSLHESFIPSFPKMRTPSIRPFRNEDNTMSIKYYSEGSSLAPFMLGALKACAAQLFDLDLDIHHRVKKGQGSTHDVFHVFLDPKGFGDGSEDLHGDMNHGVVELDEELTNSLFPWHFAFDRDMSICSVGKYLAGRIKSRDLIGSSVSKIFKLARPVDVDYEFEELRACQGMSMMFVVRQGRLLTAEQQLKVQEALAASDTLGRSLNSSTSVLSHASSNTSIGSTMSNVSDLGVRAAKLTKSMDNLKLHGEVVYHEERDVLMFVGTPSIRSIEELAIQGVTLKEMPLHSHAREILYGSMFQSASAKNSNIIDQKLADLDHTMFEVNQKKRQIDNLLHSILPPVVANSLAAGRIPPAERYQNVTVLFADIAGFTNISSDIPAKEVMDMLHELFVKFDDLADRHGCYKVETIGDAYMVACGCPEECADHALRIANLAIDMVRIAQQVISPLDGEPLRIRVGLHSGPLMAGVVGRARPRYCLFGDTVNVASRMESNGLPGAIQASYRFTQALPMDHPFEIVPRGHIEIKGKGLMKTFLVIGSLEDNDNEPLLPVCSQSEDIGPKLLDMAVKREDVTDRLAAVTSSRAAMRNRKQTNIF